jgi:hypothetical protein
LRPAWLLAATRLVSRLRLYSRLAPSVVATSLASLVAGKKGEGG